MDVILPILLSLSVLVGQMDYTKTDEFKKIIQNVERWRPLIEEVKRDDGRESVPTDLALAVIAQESKGLSRIISKDKYKSVGLMQIIPRDWVGTTEQLKDPRFNVEWGLWFLEQGLEYCGGDEHCSLRVFNCGPENALDTFCGAYYANLVTEFWRPYFKNKPESQKTGKFLLLSVPYVSQHDDDWWKANDCGPASAAMLVEYYKSRKVEAYEFSVDMGIKKWDDRYRRVEQIGDWLKLQGVPITYVHPSAWDRNFTRLSLAQGIPIIALINHPLLGNHYVVIVGMSIKNIYIHDPWFGASQSMSVDLFEKIDIWLIVPTN
jgi:hypothetical protein